MPLEPAVDGGEQDVVDCDDIAVCVMRSFGCIPAYLALILIRTYGYSTDAAASMSSVVKINDAVT